MSVIEGINGSGSFYVTVHGQNIKIGIIRNKLATGQRYHGDNGRAFGSCNQADSGPAVRRSFGYSKTVPANDCPSRSAFPESLCDQGRPCELSVPPDCSLVEWDGV